MSYGPEVTLGQKPMATSLPVAIASDQSPIPVTQSGTWNITNISGTISLPTLAATSTKQSDGSQKTQIVDGSGNVIAATSNALNVAIVSGGGSGGTASSFAAAFPATGTAIGVKEQAGTNMVALQLGQQVANSSVPIVLTSAQLTTLTPPAAITGFATAVKQPALGVAGSPSTDVISIQGVASGVAIPISGSVSVSGATSTNIATIAAGIGLEDQASANLDPGMRALILRSDTPGNTSSTDLDYEFPQMSAGRIWVSAKVDTALPAGANVIGHVIADSGSTTAVTGNVTVVQATGTNLHVVTDSGTITTVSTVTNLAQMAGAAIAMGTGVRSAGTQRVTIATDDVVPASQSGTWNITNISGTISLPTGAATETTLAKLAVTQGSTTSGQSGTLTLGAVTTAAPTYTTAQTSPLSLTTTGLLRVDGSGVTQPISGTVTANAGTGNFTVVQATGTNLHVVTDSGTITTVSTVTNLAQMAGAAIAMGTGVRTAGTQRVTIATDDVVPASQSGTWNITNISGTISLPTLAATSTKQSDGSQKTQIVDGSGNVIAATSNALNVAIVSGGGSGGTSSSFAAAFPATGTAIGVKEQAGTNMVALQLGQQVANSSVPIVLTSAQLTTLTPPAAITGFATAVKQPALGTAGTASADVITVQGIASMTALKVDGSAVTQPISGNVGISGTAGTNISNIAGAITNEDSPSANLDPGIRTLILRSDTPGNTSGTDLDYEYPQMSAGRIWVSAKIDTALPAGTNGIGKLTANSGVVIGDVNAVQSGTWTVQPGNTANTTAWKVDGSAVTQPISAASLPLPSTASTSTKQSDGSQKTQIVDGSGNVISSSTTTPADAAQALAVRNIPQKSPTGTTSNVAGSASTGTLLASNAARKGASIVNDSTAILYLKCGATASATSYTVKMVADAYYEVPFGYTGIIDGIWASATGNARVTEFT